MQYCSWNQSRVALVMTLTGRSLRTAGEQSESSLRTV